MLRNLCQKTCWHRIHNIRSAFCMPAISHIERLLRHVQRSGVVRSRDLDRLGIPRVALQRAVDRGQVGRRARGIYVKPDHATTRHTDVAVEALRDCLRKRKATPADIFEMAKIERVARVMRPYLEALT